MRERADQRMHKLLIIAGADNERGLKAGKEVNNPSSRIIVHQNAAHRDNLIHRYFLTGSTQTVTLDQSQISERRSLQDPMEWE